jgi:uncharacterized protein YjcR
MNGPTVIPFAETAEHPSDEAMVHAHLRRKCRQLFFRKWPIALIHAETGVNYNTLASWKKRDKWDAAAPVDIVDEAYEAKILEYLDRPDMTEGDMKRLDFCTRQMERIARIRKYNDSGKEADLNPKIAARNDDKAKEKRALKANTLSADMIEQCREFFEDNLFTHQKAWWEASDEVIRFILKSRQIGATWYFAREAFMRGMDTGNNQIFLSASRDQADVFKAYIQDFVYLATGIELKGQGKKMTVKRVADDGERLSDVTFYFLATNFRTAQSYHGDVYLDEVFWVPGFDVFGDVAMGMASQKQYRITLFSTPSTVNHPAYKKWGGAEYNDGRPKRDQQNFNVGHHALKNGHRGPDGIWRHIVTLDDAIAGGFDLINRASIEQRYSPERFRNLYLCEFLDDSMSSFPFALLAPCMVSPLLAWRDFKPADVGVDGLRPFGDKPVLISIDPNHDGADDAAIAVLALPEKAGGKFRLLQKIRFTGQDFEGQDRLVKQVSARYNVVDISVDVSDAYGKAIFGLIAKWFPTVRGVAYSVVTKGLMVQKAQNVMRNKRFEFDAGASDVVSAFMAVHPVLTNSGKQVTYATSRAGNVGHGDIAWAIMMALSIEPLDASSPTMGGGGRVVFSD